MMTESNPVAAGKSIQRDYDIPGAPFSIGEKVKITNISDPQTLDYIDFLKHDMEEPDDLIGLKGTILYYEYDCGCGQQFPNDPMIGIKLGNGMEIEFWSEELAIQ